jgi:hypothetical protein
MYGNGEWLGWSSKGKRNLISQPFVMKKIDIWVAASYGEDDNVDLGRTAGPGTHRGGGQELGQLRIQRGGAWRWLAEYGIVGGALGWAARGKM